MVHARGVFAPDATLLLLPPRRGCSRPCSQACAASSSRAATFWGYLRGGRGGSQVA